MNVIVPFNLAYCTTAWQPEGPARRRRRENNDRMTWRFMIKALFFVIVRSENGRFSRVNEMQREANRCVRKSHRSQEEILLLAVSDRQSCPIVKISPKSCGDNDDVFMMMMTC